MNALPSPLNRARETHVNLLFSPLLLKPIMTFNDENNGM